MKIRFGKVLGWLLFIGIVAFLAVRYNNTKFTEKMLAELTQSASETAQQKADLLKNHWQVNTTTDAMTDKEIIIASVQSQNKANFDFPYEGGSSMTMNIRKKNDDIDVYFTISKGQFVCSEHSGTDVFLIRFDDEEAVKYKMVEAATGDSDILFIKSPTAEKTILSKCKSALSIKVQANFYNEGSRVFEFKVEEPLSDL